MNVSLTPDLDRFVASKVASGRYTSASEVVREALRLLEEREMERKMQVEAFNHELKSRLDSLDRGETLDPAQVLDEIRRKSRERRKLSA